MSFRTPMINIYSMDLPKAVSFYQSLGFSETFRIPKYGAPLKVEMALDGFSLGIATVEAARSEHGLDPKGEGRWIEIAIWTDHVDEETKKTDCGGRAVAVRASRISGR